MLQLRLATLAARRTTGVFVVLWITIVLAIAVNTRPESVKPIDSWTTPHFGLAREHMWTWFLIAVAPLLVLRAVRRAAPKPAEDASWLATKRVSNATIALSTWTGVFIPWCLAAGAFAAFSDIGAPPEERLVVACGTCTVPTGQWFETGAPLEWTAAIPAGVDPHSATIELGIGSAHGGTCEVTTSVTQGGDVTSYRKRMSGRGEITILFDHKIPIEEPTLRFDIQAAEQAIPVAFELACSGEGARALILSPYATLWTRASSRISASVNIALGLVLAGAAWSALALAFACFVGATTAAFGVLALWLPVWMSDWPLTITRWIPGADLFEALTIVGSGRAPAAPTVHTWIGAFAIVAAALALQTLGLSRWRVSR